jgi:hypothetical protein
MTWTQCPERTTLTAEELAGLAGVPGGAHELRPEMQCALQAAHSGPHTAMGQSYSGQFGPFEHWLTWGLGERRVIVYRQDELCPAEFSSPTWPADITPCPLPAGHEGTCSPVLLGPPVSGA